MKLTLSKSGRWGMLILWMILIFVLSHQPKSAIPSYGPWDLLVKKGAHFLAYGLFALLARSVGFASLPAWLLAVAYGASDELHQLQITGRNGRLADVLIDGAGAGTVLILLSWIQIRAPGLAQFLQPQARSARKDGVGEP